jgi:hypothetical protein
MYSKPFALDRYSYLGLYRLHVHGSLNFGFFEGIIFLFPRGEIKGGYMYLSPVLPQNRP